MKPLLTLFAFLLISGSLVSQPLQKGADSTSWLIGAGIGVNNIIGNDVSGNSALSASLHIGVYMKLSRRISSLALFSYNYRSTQSMYGNMRDYFFDIPIYLQTNFETHEFNPAFLFYYDNVGKTRLSLGCGLILKYIFHYTIDQHPLGDYGKSTGTINAWYGLYNVSYPGFLQKTNIAPAFSITYPLLNDRLLLVFASSYDIRASPVRPYFRPTPMFNYFNLLTNQIIITFKLNQHEKPKRKN